MSPSPWTALSDQLAQAATEGFCGSVLVTVGGETVLEACHGPAERASGSPIHPGTRFALASLSKMFTAQAALTCVRAGELRLDEPLARVLPAERRPRTMDPAVTTHHLLTHTSGIGDYAEEDEEVPEYVADYASLWVTHPAHQFREPIDFLPLFADAPAAVPTGVNHYSNAGYILLALVIEQVTGGRFIDVVTERVLQPAGMAESGYFANDEPVPDVATGYLPPTAEGAPWRSNVFSTPVIGGGDGGAHSTPRDITALLAAIESGALVGPELRDLAFTHHARVGEDLSMGYGIFVGDDGRFGHGGGDPGVETLCRRYPGKDLTMVMLSNVDEGLGAVYEPVLQAVSAYEPESV